MDPNHTGMSQKHCLYMDCIMEDLCRTILPNSTLKRNLVSDGLYGTLEITQLCSHGENTLTEDIVFELLTALQRKPDHYYDKFISCLRASKQHEAADLLAVNTEQFDQTPLRDVPNRILSPYFEKSATLHYDRLIDALAKASPRVYDKFISKGVLISDFNRIHRSSASDLKARRLIDNILKSGDQNFINFLSVLEIAGETVLAKEIKTFAEYMKNEMEIVAALGDCIERGSTSPGSVCDTQLNVSYTRPLIRNVRSGTTVDDYTDLLFTDDNTQRILLYGSRGTGKTTVVYTFLKSWRIVKQNEKEYGKHRLNAIKFMFPLAHNLICKDDTLPKVLCSQLHLKDKLIDFLIEHLKVYQKRALFIFDNMSITSAKELYEFERRLFGSINEVSLMYVGRRSYQIYKGINNCSVYEMCGLTKGGAIEYIKKIAIIRNKEQNLNELIEIVQSCTEFDFLAKVPLYTQILCMIWIKTGMLDKTLIYTNILKTALKNKSDVSLDSDLTLDVETLDVFCNEIILIGNAICSQPSAIHRKITIATDDFKNSKIREFLGMLPVDVEDRVVSFPVSDYQYFLAAVYLFFYGKESILNFLFDKIFTEICKDSIHILEYVYSLAKHTAAKRLTQIHYKMAQYISENKNYVECIRSVAGFDIVFPAISLKEHGQSIIIALEEKLREVEKQSLLRTISPSNIKYILFDSMLYFSKQDDQASPKETVISNSSDTERLFWLYAILCFPKLEVLLVDCTAMSAECLTILGDTLRGLSTLTVLELVGLCLDKDACHIFQQFKYLANLRKLSLTISRIQSECIDTIAKPLQALKWISYFGLSIPHYVEHSNVHVKLLKHLESSSVKQIIIDKIDVDCDLFVLFQNFPCLDTVSFSRCQVLQLGEIYSMEASSFSISITSITFKDVLLANAETESIIRILILLRNLQRLYISYCSFISKSACMDLSKALASLTNLKSLTVLNEDKGHSGFCGDMPITHYPEILEELVISNCICIANNDSSDFFYKLSSLSGLHTLSLINCCLEDHSLKLLMESLSKFTSLTSLNLRKCGEKTVVLSEQLIKLLQNSSKLRSLDLSGYVGASTIFNSICIVMPHWADIAAISLADCGLTDPGIMSLFIEKLKKVVHVEILDLSGNNVGDKGFMKLASVLRYIPKLRSLSLNDCKCNDSLSFANFSSALANTPNLERLFLSKNNAGIKGAVRLAGSLSGLKHLKVLDLSYLEGLDSNTEKMLIRSLKTLKRLETLILDGVKFKKDCFHALSIAINSLKSIKQLSLHDCGCNTKNILEELITALESAENLEVLDLVNNLAGKSSIKYLSACIPSWRNLRELNLENCGCEDASAMEDLCKNLGQTSIEALQLSNNTLGFNGFLALAEVLPKLKKIRFLYLDGCGCKNPRAFSRLVVSLSCLSNLRYLNLANNKADEKGTKSLIETISSLPCLILLNLCNTDLVISKQLVDVITEQHNHLEFLDLSENITSIYVYTFLLKNTFKLVRLSHLYLPSCECEDAEIVQLFLKERVVIKKLEGIDIFGVEIDLTATTLREVLSGFCRDISKARAIKKKTKTKDITEIKLTASSNKKQNSRKGKFVNLSLKYKQNELTLSDRATSQ